MLSTSITILCIGKSETSHSTYLRNLEFSKRLNTSWIDAYQVQRIFGRSDGIFSTGRKGHAREWIHRPFCQRGNHGGIRHSAYFSWFSKSSPVALQQGFVTIQRSDVSNPRQWDTCTHSCDLCRETTRAIRRLEQNDYLVQLSDRSAADWDS